MAKSTYILFNDSAFADQLQTFKTTIGSYAATLGIPAAQITAQAADADYYAYVVACRQIMQNASSQWSEWRKLMRDGGPLPPAGAPVAPPVFPAVVPAVAPGIESRFRALVRQIKASPNYNPAIGEALGIEGTEQATPDLSTVQPQFTVTINGGQAFIGWTWQGLSEFLHQCELEVDRGDGFKFLAQDSTPGYTDTTPFPATPTKWTYRAIFRGGDSRVGQWSNPVSVTVGG
jgi:hypothetical protein